MRQRLTDKIVKELKPPEKGNRISYDNAVPGFGVRITKAGTKAFVLNYRTRTGLERRYTIGDAKTWQTTAAREEAKRLKRHVDQGGDPLGEIHEDKAAPTVSDMCQRFKDEHFPKLRASSQRDYAALIDKKILPSLGRKKVADIDYEDIDALHRKITRSGAKYTANRTVAVLSKMFSLAVRWKWRPDNPVKGIERNQERKRHRYLSGDEMTRLTATLAEYPDQQAADIFRLLLLTGARRGEVLAARWDQFTDGFTHWIKPGSTTKQKTEHRAPLNAPARQLLADLRAKADPDAVYVFSGRSGEGHRVEVKSAWAKIRKVAKIEDVRIHDLRHSYASMLASAGLSLPVIGALLGHSQPATTARYAHLFDDPLREATERVGAIVTGQPSADVVPLRQKDGA